MDIFSTGFTSFYPGFDFGYLSINPKDPTKNYNTKGCYNRIYIEGHFISTITLTEQ